MFNLIVTYLILRKKYLNLIVNLSSNLKLEFLYSFGWYTMIYYSHSDQKKINFIFIDSNELHLLNILFYFVSIIISQGTFAQLRISWRKLKFGQFQQLSYFIWIDKIFYITFAQYIFRLSIFSNQNLFTENHVFAQIIEEGCTGWWEVRLHTQETLWTW